MTKRDLRKKRKQLHLHELLTIKQWWARFPEVDIVSLDRNHPASSDFVEAVRQAIGQLPRIDQKKHFPPHWMLFYQGVKNVGIEAILAVNEGLEKTLGAKHVFKTKLGCMLHLGQIVWDIMLGNHTLNRFLPYSDIFVRFMDKRIMIQLDQMLTAKTRYGTAYYSRYRPTVKLGEQDHIVAFSQHAIERITERVVFDWHTYQGYGDAFGVYGRCIHFEPCQMQYQGQRQPAFTFYMPCSEHHFSNRIRDIMLDYRIDPDKKYYFRVGYCPVSLENGFARAITTLYPGMVGTPEHSLLMATKLSYLEKTRLVHSLEAMSSYKALCETEDFIAMKWIHDHYVPQVVDLPLDIYRYD